MRRPIIAGNWKMNKTIPEGLALADGIKRKIVEFNWSQCEVIVCPAFTALYAVSQMINAAGIQLGAQDVYWEDSGAFTGEISCGMIRDAGCGWSIIGHSERRQFYGETNETVNMKLKALLAQELSAILCIGESLKQRDDGKTLEVLRDHIEGGLKDITTAQMRRVVIAYEPVWAIGTGRTAAPEQAQEAHNFVRGLLVKLFDQATADTVRILYGGSVKPTNIEDLIIQPDIDGALVGGASLTDESFVNLIRTTCVRG